MRILIACSGVGHVARGYETASVALVEALRGHVHVTIARGGGSWTVRDGIRLPCIQRFSPLATKISEAGSTSAYLVEQRSFAPFVYAYARFGGFDVVHLHDPGLMNALWHIRRTFGGRFGIVFTNGAPLSPEHVTRPDIVQSVTPLDAAALAAAGFPGSRVAMIPHCIHHVRTSARPFVSDQPRAFIGVGTLNDTHKGFATAIRAVAAIPDATLKLLGQADAETPVIEMLGREMLGPRFSCGTVLHDVVSSELASADVFVLPTRNEGFCIAALEAMAAGIPCVVSDIPVLRWLIGDAGILVPHRNQTDWIQALKSLTISQCRKLSERGIRRAAEFLWDKHIGHYLELYAASMVQRRVSVPLTREDKWPKSTAHDAG